MNRRARVVKRPSKRAVPRNVRFQKQIGSGILRAAATRGNDIGVNVRRMDSDASPRDRSRIVRLFAPKSNDAAELTGSEKEIDILISTTCFQKGRICRIAVT
jgi:hypothetical protein